MAGSPGRWGAGKAGRRVVDIVTTNTGQPNIKTGSAEMSRNIFTTDYTDGTDKKRQ
jgi:hypothetical protein